ncbi:MAG: hypothetical protein APF84_17355 [Gracilibacter sp. BRH_c7a]|nr:MAG: hypothetical protein APF84_17355 [Gracilibacter sp. BRH_c7a]
MVAMDVTNVDSNYLNYSTGLLVSILLRYPEVGTISCCQKQQALILKFLVTKDCKFEGLKTKLTQALEMFHKIEGRKMRLFSIEKQEQELDLLVITRDLGSITQNEMNLIVEIIKNDLEKQLIVDDSNLMEEEIVFQEETINHMLAAIRSNGTEKNITALRDDGRVLVFNG